ncbi:MAG: hypothetical protein O3B84_05420 [Chloroflexi bacterium]|nr:hypothetical protein [Chloroflexota bacterium]
MTISVPHLLTSAMLLALLVAGCSTSDATPTRIAGQVLDEDIVKRLVTGDDIAAVGGDGGGLSAGVENLREFAGSIDPAQVEGVDAWFTLRLASTDGPGLLLTIKRFASAVLANRALAVVESGGSFQSMDIPIGDRSALSPANPDSGAAIALLENDTLVSIQLPVTADGATLLDDQQLTSLARIIADRL